VDDPRYPCRWRSWGSRNDRSNARRRARFLPIRMPIASTIAWLNISPAYSARLPKRARMSLGLGRLHRNEVPGHVWPDLMPLGLHQALVREDSCVDQHFLDRRGDGVALRFGKRL
jgi:hypothetical protein